MRRGLIALLFLFCLLAPFATERAFAQGSSDIGIRGYASFGGFFPLAKESYDAVFDTKSLPTFGGGIEVTFHDHIFVGVGAWYASHDGERVFVSGDNDQVFKLGIPVKLKLRPIEVTGGWRMTNFSQRFVPYLGGGFTSLSYSENADTDSGDEDVDHWFNGFHLLGGVDVRVRSWLGVAGEVVWTSVPDAIGDTGVSHAFDETNLGGTSVRIKVVVGR